MAVAETQKVNMQWILVNPWSGRFKEFSCGLIWIQANEPRTTVQSNTFEATKAQGGTKYEIWRSGRLDD